MVKFPSKSSLLTPCSIKKYGTTTVRYHFISLKWLLSKRKHVTGISFKNVFLVSPTNESNETNFVLTHDTPDLEFYVNCGKQMTYETL